jgi:hypothetical protein
MVAKKSKYHKIAEVQKTISDGVIEYAYVPAVKDSGFKRSKR